MKGEKKRFEEEEKKKKLTKRLGGSRSTSASAQQPQDKGRVGRGERGEDGGMGECEQQTMPRARQCASVEKKGKHKKLMLLVYMQLKYTGKHNKHTIINKKKLV